MFDNIGSKLKTVAEVYVCLGICASVLIGLIEMCTNDVTPIFGLFIIALGSIGSYISSLFIYGLGQSIENTDKLVAALDDEDAEIKESSEAIPQVTCPQCGTKHDFDYPKCPKCKYQYNWSK